jgi:hypothetical protein
MTAAATKSLTSSSVTGGTGRHGTKNSLPQPALKSPTFWSFKALKTRARDGQGSYMQDFNPFLVVKLFKETKIWSSRKGRHLTHSTLKLPHVYPLNLICQNALSVLLHFPKQCDEYSCLRNSSSSSASSPLAPWNLPGRCRRHSPLEFSLGFKPIFQPSISVPDLILATPEK